MALKWLFKYSKYYFNYFVTKLILLDFMMQIIVCKFLILFFNILLDFVFSFVVSIKKNLTFCCKVLYAHCKAMPNPNMLNHTYNDKTNQSKLNIKSMHVLHITKITINWHLM